MTYFSPHKVKSLSYFKDHRLYPHRCHLIKYILALVVLSVVLPGQVYLSGSIHFSATQVSGFTLFFAVTRSSQSTVSHIARVELSFSREGWTWEEGEGLDEQLRSWE